MPVAYLNDGATSLAAANFSDATGFATNAELVIGGATTGIISDLDQSGVATGINSLIVGPSFNGTIGNESVGPLIVDADDVTGVWTSAAPTPAKVVYNATGGSWRLRAGGGSAVISNAFMDAPGATWFWTGGTFTTSNFYRGTANVNSSTTLVTANVDGGSVTIEYKASGLTTLNIYAGTVTCKRPASTIINLYNGTLILDDDGATATVAITQTGGNFIHVAGNVTTHNAYAGTYTAARLRKVATIATRNRRRGFTRQDNATFLIVTSDVRLYPTDEK